MPQARQNGEPNKTHTRHLLPSMRPLITRWRDRKEAVWLYVIECEGFIKIGVTQNIEQRMKNATADNPFPINLIYSQRIPANLASEIEMAAHIALERDHHHGDWFHSEIREAIAAASDAIFRFSRLSTATGTDR